jgi:hypothetical protein
MRKFILFVVFLGIKITFAQSVVKAYFLSDSVKIGSDINLAFSCIHNGKKELIFPNSSSNFSPFVFKKLKYFNTEKIGSYFKDSVIYTLQTFSADSILKLKLSVLTLPEKKKYVSNMAQVPLKWTIGKKDLNKPILKPLINFVEVPLDINYPRFLYYFSISLGLIYLVWILTGKLIIRTFKVFLYRKKHKDFNSKIKKLLGSNTNLDSYKNSLILWKKHLEWLIDKPISTMSTKEINENLANDDLNEALTYIDASIFGGQDQSKIKFAFDKIVIYANQAFKTQIETYKTNLKK